MSQRRLFSSINFLLQSNNPNRGQKIGSKKHPPRHVPENMVIEIPKKVKGKTLNEMMRKGGSHFHRSSEFPRQGSVS